MAVKIFISWGKIFFFPLTPKHHFIKKIEEFEMSIFAIDYWSQRTAFLSR
jgi:hypothetical protein